MITLRRGEKRRHDGGPKRQVWFTFNPEDRTDPLADGFGSLEILDEGRLSPGAGVPHHPQHDAEIVTYVREGALAYEDSMGRSGIIHAGEFQRTTAGRGLRHHHTNPSRTDWAHVFQIWLHPSETELEPGHEQKRFSAAARRGELCVVASSDGRRDSLHIHQDALMFSCLLDSGQHVVHPLPPEHGAWIHVVEGEVVIGDVVLTTGDGAGLKAERAVSFTAREKTEVLVLDFGVPQKSTEWRGHVPTSGHEVRR